MDIKKIKRNSRKAADWLKAVAHSDRLFILCQLIDNEYSVSDLQKNSQLSQSAFSQHLAVLREKKLVKTRKEAQTVFYSIADKDSVKLLHVLHEIFCS